MNVMEDHVKRNFQEILTKRLAQIETALSALSLELTQIHDLLKALHSRGQSATESPRNLPP